MRHKLLLLMSMFIVLFSALVLALSPSLETECCLYLGHEEDVYYGDSLLARCQEFNLTKEKCEPILEGWKLTQDEFAGSTYLPDDYEDDLPPVTFLDRVGYSVFAMIMLLSQWGVFKILFVLFILWLIFKKFRKKK